MSKPINTTTIAISIALCLLPLILNAKNIVPQNMQGKVELMIDVMKTNIDADEIIVGIMESQTGKVISLASTSRYDPSNISQKDALKIDSKFSTYPYEAGSVIKPLSISVALDKGLVTPDTWINTYEGKLQIGENHFIADDEKFNSLNVTDIVVHSSNIGTAQISWKLTGQDFRDGLLKFGLATPSGINLPSDLPGHLKTLKFLNHQLHRANTSYGYGMRITFAQLLKAYSAFNNDGIIVTPKIMDNPGDVKGKHDPIEKNVGELQAISKKTANQMHNILIEVVKRGTGVKAQYPGLEIGGKTGTAHIAKSGRYVREYNSSFYGFANDNKGHKYTIGALVIRAKKYRHYFASKSAVPTFRNLVQILVEEGKLIPNAGMAKKMLEVDMSGSAPADNKTISIP